MGETLRRLARAAFGTALLLPAGGCARSALETRPPSSRPGFLTYRDEKDGFEISYPETMKTTRRFAGRYFVRAGAWRLGAGETRAGVRAGGEPGRPAVAVVVYRPNGEEGYPDVEVRVGIRPGKTPGEACGRVPSDGAARPPARIDGREFSVSDLSDAGMSQYVRGESYRAFRDGACYAVERFVTDTDLPPDGREREKREADAVAESYYRKTKEIVESFRLLPGRARGTGRR